MYGLLKDYNIQRTNIKLMATLYEELAELVPKCLIKNIF